ncbi:MAG: hypothetical protein K2H36_04120, partial [Clostridia bacterium]|nr:hypothetical protein [Clostridia bacterium]
MDTNKKIVKWQYVFLLLLIACICFGSTVLFFLPYYTAKAMTNIDLEDTTKYFNIGDLLLKNYETRTDNVVFDGKQLDVLYAALLGEEKKTINDVKSETSGTSAVKTSEDFRNSYTDSKDIVVTLGGYKWTAVYLSNTKADGSGDPVVTLWLANSDQLPDDYKTAQWNYSSNDGDGDYPSNMYSSSMIRTLTLNNAGTYYEDNAGGNPHAVTPSESNPFALFTMENSSTLKGSLYDFIEAPSNVYWQGTLSAKELVKFSYNCSNDAYIVDPTSTGFFDESHNYYKKSGYTDWQYDKIWLPAVAEAGRNETYRGLWQTDVLQRCNVYNSWTRTTNSDNFINVSCLTSGGDRSYDVVNGLGTIRPALHLNLKSADLYSMRNIDNPKDVNVEYTGLPLTLADVADSQKSWYDPSSIDLSYLTSSMVNADTYQVKATINDELKAEGVKFSGEPDASKGEDEYTRYFNFTITKKKIGVDIDNPSGGGELIVTPKTGAVYTGDTEANKRAP